MTSPAHVVGIDGWRDGWIAARLPMHGATAADVELHCHDDFADVLASHGNVALVGVDIPLSLPSAAERQSDADLRSHLGARASSLFATPCREAAAQPSWEAANETSKELTGKGMSKQTWNLMPKVTEARTALRERSDLARLSDGQAVGGQVFEVHPESSFVAMGESDQLGSKRTAAGIGRRLGLLEADLGPLGEAIAGSPPGPALDDVLDALAVCWTLRRVADQTALWFGPPGADDEGFPTSVPV